MAGEVFELREPQKRDSHHVVDVVQNGVTKRYTVRLSSHFYAQGRTLSDALHQLANKLDAAKVFGAESYDPERLTGKKLRLCQYCGAAIFFARTQNNKWLPLDADSIDAGDAQPVRTFGLIDSGGSPHVRSLSNPEGQVWVAHPDVCGAQEIAPESTALQQRWVVNRKQVVERKTEAVTDLTQIVHDLEDADQPLPER